MIACFRLERLWGCLGSAGKSGEGLTCMYRMGEQGIAVDEVRPQLS